MNVFDGCECVETLFCHFLSNTFSGRRHSAGAHTNYKCLLLRRRASYMPFLIKSVVCCESAPPQFTAQHRNIRITGRECECGTEIEWRHNTEDSSDTYERRKQRKALASKSETRRDANKFKLCITVMPNGVPASCGAVLRSADCVRAHERVNVFYPSLNAWRTCGSSEANFTFSTLKYIYVCCSLLSVGIWHHIYTRLHTFAIRIDGSVCAHTNYNYK